MRKSKFSETHIVAMLKDAETCCGSTASARRRSSSAEQVRGASVSEVKRLRELEAENAKVKRMYALENAAIKS